MKTAFTKLKKKLTMTMFSQTVKYLIYVAPNTKTLLPIVFVQSFAAGYQIENGEVVGAAPTGDAPTRSEWSTIVLPT